MILVNEVPVDEVLVALNGVALGSKGSTVSGLRRLRAAFPAVVLDERPGARDTLAAHLFAKKLFHTGLRIVRDGTRRRLSERSIRERLAEFATGMTNDRGLVPCSFRYRAVADGGGRTRLELSKIEAHDMGALIAYAFWVVAPTLPLGAWERYANRTCPVCGRVFVDDRDRLYGGVKKVCSEECRSRQDRHSKKRRTKR